MNLMDLRLCPKCKSSNLSEKDHVAVSLLLKTESLPSTSPTKDPTPVLQPERIQLQAMTAKSAQENEKAANYVSMKKETIQNKPPFLEKPIPTPTAEQEISISFRSPPLTFDFPQEILDELQQIAMEVEPRVDTVDASSSILRVQDNATARSALLGGIGPEIANESELCMCRRSVNGIYCDSCGLYRDGRIDHRNRVQRRCEIHPEKVM